MNTTKATLPSNAMRDCYIYSSIIILIPALQATDEVAGALFVDTCIQTSALNKNLNECHLLKSWGKKN